MKNFVLAICGASLLALAAPLAQADTVYTFTGSAPSGNPAIAFVYNSPTTITSTTTVDPPFCTVNGFSICTSVVFSVVGTDEDLTVNYTNGSLTFEFPDTPPAFSTAGPHFTDGTNPGLLIANQPPAPP